MEGAFSTAVMAIAVLLVGTESKSAPDTVTLLVSVRAEPGATTKATLTTVPLAIAPKPQETVPPFSAQDPWEGNAEINATPAGSTSVRTTSAAKEGPAFVTVML